MANQSTNSGYPTFCANNCGFYGNPETNNLCSICYKDYVTKQTKELGNCNSILSSNKSNVGEEEMNSSSSSSSSSCSGVEARASNRCNYCKKKVGLTGFKCRCEQMFCSLHRYSNEHDCVFDYKAAGQDAIARDNPVVKADKVEKI